jgi:ribonuclease BN (tRNA processing enzyme)
MDYLNEGFGDSQMLSSAGSRLLIDTYSPGAWDVLDSWLNDKKYMDFDIYISHYHNDHMGNVINILNDGKYKVSKLYLPDYGYMTGSSSYMRDYRSDCQDIMSTARAKGVPMVKVIFKHALRNALIPVITYVGPMLAYILTGSLVVENIFTIGGLGQQFVKSISNRDYPMIMATTIFLAVVMVICNLLSDIAYKIVDPRITLD